MKRLKKETDYLRKVANKTPIAVNPVDEFNLPKHIQYPYVDNAKKIIGKLGDGVAPVRTEVLLCEYLIKGEGTYYEILSSLGIDMAHIAMDIFTLGAFVRKYDKESAPGKKKRLSRYPTYFLVKTYDTDAVCIVLIVKNTVDMRSAVKYTMNDHFYDRGTKSKLYITYPMTE